MKRQRRVMTETGAFLLAMADIAVGMLIGQICVASVWIGVAVVHLVEVCRCCSQVRAVWDGKCR